MILIDVPPPPPTAITYTSLRPKDEIKRSSAIVCWAHRGRGKGKLFN